MQTAFRFFSVKQKAGWSFFSKYTRIYRCCYFQENYTHVFIIYIYIMTINYMWVMWCWDVIWVQRFTRILYRWGMVRLFWTTNFCLSYIPWPPQTMKNKGFGHLETRLSSIKTSKSVGLGGPWYIYIQHHLNIHAYIHRYTSLAVLA